MEGSHSHAVEQHDTTGPDEADATGTAVTPGSVLELAAAGFQFGDAAEFEKDLSDKDMREFATQTMLSERVHHCMPVNSLILGALERLPMRMVSLTGTEVLALVNH